MKQQGDQSVVSDLNQADNSVSVARAQSSGVIVAYIFWLMAGPDK